MNATPTDERPGLGTFLGVYTPTVLTILGVIMYLRSGWVVGQVGVAGALSIVLIAHLITVLTSLSMSALATSMRVGVGGAYYLISRSIGLGVGGAIGIPLYLSQALSVTLYAYGLAEVARMAWPTANVPAVAAGVVVVVSLVAARSTELALRLQLPIMALILASLLSLFGGADWGGGLQTGWLVEPEAGVSYWRVFAVFFPAVTGILAGVSLSGDLEDPGRAIPRGTLAAVATGGLVYLAVPFALGHAADAETLRSAPRVWTDIALIPWLVLPGMVGAILSSAFGSILGAPRTLQALASDGLAPGVFSRTNDRGEPIVAMRLTSGVALAAVFLGSLDLVATVLTMFFLTTYATLNLVAATEDLVHDPSYRPRIRVPWWASLLGATGCAAVMLLVSWPAALVALATEVAVFFVLRRRAMRATWGDVRSGAWYSLARWALQGLAEARHDPRNWRPHILLFVRDLERSIRIAHFANDFGQQRGIVTISTLVMGDPDDLPDIAAIEARHRDVLDERKLVAFPEVDWVPDLASGVLTVAQANGFAGLTSNTCMFGWPDDVEGLATLLGISRKLSRLGRCTCVVRLVDSGHPAPAGEAPVAMVWWKGKQSNGDLMLLLAHLLGQSAHWRGLEIRLRSIATSPEEAQRRRAEIDELLPHLNMAVDADVLMAEAGDVPATLRAHSREASLVFLGLREVPQGEEAADAEALVRLTEGLPTTVLVRNAGSFRGRLL